MMRDAAGKTPVRRIYPKLWKICMEDLGVNRVLAYMRENTTGNLKSRFGNCPEKRYRQTELF